MLHMSDVFASSSDVLADLEELDAVLGDEREDADLEPRQPYLNRLAMQAAQRRWQRHEKDSGSAEVQAAILTERIIYMTKHLQQHPKDVHSRRGLVTMVNKRRHVMNYLFETEGTKAVDLARTLGIRFRPPSKYETREEKYAAFKSNKSKVGVAIRSVGRLR
ncbi:unnamed protein product [Phaeothamnion confervicola]